MGATTVQCPVQIQQQHKKHAKVAISSTFSLFVVKQNFYISFHKKFDFGQLFATPYYSATVPLQKIELITAISSFSGCL